MDWYNLGLIAAAVVWILIHLQGWYVLIGNDENGALAMTVVSLVGEVALVGLIIFIGSNWGYLNTVAAFATVSGLPALWFGGAKLIRPLPSKIAQWWLKEKQVAKSLDGPPPPSPDKIPPDSHCWM